MVRDAGQTKGRLLVAATQEFSRHGIAGARVDRVAAQAACNKSLIYTYFGSKEQLFDAVMSKLLMETVAEVPITADDLPGYVAALFDRYVKHPELLRLATWQRLERDPDAGVHGLIQDYDEAKVAAIKAAQRRGTVRRDIAASELLVLLIGLSVSSALRAPGLDPNRLPAAVRRRQRAALIAAVAAITGPA
jgi:AcrR family transcriptional regulator